MDLEGRIARRNKGLVLLATMRDPSASRVRGTSHDMPRSMMNHTINKQAVLSITVVRGLRQQNSGRFVIVVTIAQDELIYFPADVPSSALLGELVDVIIGSRGQPYCDDHVRLSLGAILALRPARVV